HLTHDYLNMLVVDVHTLQAIDLLNFIHEILLQATHTEYSQNIVRVQRTSHQSLAGTNTISVLHVDVRTARDVVLAFFTVVASDDQFAFALRDRTKSDCSIYFRHNRGLSGTAGFEKLDHARQTASDVFGLGS